MDSFSPMLLLATSMLAVSAAALTGFALTQRSYHGFQWWNGAIALNAAGLGLMTWLDSSRLALPLAQLLFVPWPVLMLLGLRRFHARVAFATGERTDAWLLGSTLACATLALLGFAETPAVPWITTGAAAAMLLYASAVLWQAPPGRDVAALRALSVLCLLVAVLPLLATQLLPNAQAAAEVQASVVATGSIVLAFMALILSSQRTERELRHSRRRLRVLANIDMLTQVPNRRHFAELARRALSSDEPGSAALLLLDIDHFKQINDKLGHAAGDRALRLVSRCTQELLRSNDVAGRHGGDEFVLLLRRSSTHDAMLVAQRLVAHLQAQSHAHALPRLSLSFGIVQMRDGESIDDTLQRADQALYEAKRQGRSRAVWADGDEQQPVFSTSQRLGLTHS
jgi:diguanylate cyclase (GGDEF)-like protein